VLPSISAPSKRWLRRLAATLDEGPLGVMSGDELSDDLDNLGRHGHSLDNIAAGISASPSAGSAVTARISYGGSEATGRKATHNAGAPDVRLLR
jgi:hypothetical protein